MKTKQKTNWMVFVVAIIIFTACSNPDSNNKKNPSENKDQLEQNGTGIISQEEQDQGLTQSDIMRRYFPLKVGNTWTYKRTLKDPENVYTYTEKTTTEAGWSIPKGMIYFTVGRPLMREKSGTSKETYTITGKDEYNYFNVNLKGSKNYRDGRYYEDMFSPQPIDPNIRWKYVGEGIWELIDGYYGDAKTENQTWMAVLKPDITLSNPTKENEDPPWIVGATMYNGKITVPAGTFSDVLENVTMVGGSNIGDVLTKNAPMKVTKEDDFGCYMTKSYYAKGVGLVLEIQLNTKNNETYRLELESYKIN